jgi:hypothetical protein
VSLSPNVVPQLMGLHASWWSAWRASVPERTFVVPAGQRPLSRART